MSEAAEFGWLGDVSINARWASATSSALVSSSAAAATADMDDEDELLNMGFPVLVDFVSHRCRSSCSATAAYWSKRRKIKHERKGKCGVWGRGTIKPLLVRGFK